MTCGEPYTRSSSYNALSCCGGGPRPAVDRRDQPKVQLKRFNIDDVWGPPLYTLLNEVGEAELVEHSPAGIMIEGDSQIRLEAILELEIAKVNKVHVEEIMAARVRGPATKHEAP